MTAIVKMFYSFLEPVEFSTAIARGVSFTNDSWDANARFDTWAENCFAGWVPSRQLRTSAKFYLTEALDLGARAHAHQAWKYTVAHGGANFQYSTNEYVELVSAIAAPTGEVLVGYAVKPLARQEFHDRSLLYHAAYRLFGAAVAGRWRQNASAKLRGYAEAAARVYHARAFGHVVTPTDQLFTAFTAYQDVFRPDVEWIAQATPDQIDAAYAALTAGAVDVARKLLKPPARTRARAQNASQLSLDSYRAAGVSSSDSSLGDP